MGTDRGPGHMGLSAQRRAPTWSGPLVCQVRDSCLESRILSPAPCRFPVQRMGGGMCSDPAIGTGPRTRRPSGRANPARHLPPGSALASRPGPPGTGVLPTRRSGLYAFRVCTAAEVIADLGFRTVVVARAAGISHGAAPAALGQRTTLREVGLAPFPALG
jgi:hypothetical protein